MKNILTTLLFVFVSATSGWAVTIGTYDFLDYNNGGEGRVRMVIDVTGNTLSADIFNLSSTATVTGGLNISAITGFAFDFTQSPLTVGSWSLQAQTSPDVYIELNNPSLGQKAWTITPTNNEFSGTFTSSVDPSLNTSTLSVDFLANAVQDPKGGLYNYELMNYAGTNNINFFTKAEFSVTFSNASSLVLQNVYTRMQRVGTNAEGSLKLIGVFTPWGGGTGDPIVVPEPGTLILLGAGLVGLGWFQRRRSGRS